MTTRSTSPQKNHYIQNLRGYAAILVVIDHALQTLVHAGILPKRVDYVADDLGAAGVHIFFAISGFIMMHVAFDSFGKPFAPQRFLLARIKRIVPLYYVATVVAIGIHALEGSRPYSWSDIVLSMFFMPSHAHLDVLASTRSLYPILAVGWTLNYEMFFYLLFAIALFFRMRVGVGFMACLLLLLVAVGSGEKMFSPHLLGTTLLFEIAHYFTRDIMLYFVLGIIISLFAKGKRWPSLSIPMPALLGCSLSIVELCTLNYLMPNQYPAWRAALTILVAFVAVGLCAIATPSKQNGLAEKLGDASYSIYLFHGFFLLASFLCWQRWVGGFYAGEIFFAVLFGIGGGYLTYSFIERPLSIRVNRKRTVVRPTVETDKVSVEVA